MTPPKTAIDELLINISKVNLIAIAIIQVIPPISLNDLNVSMINGIRQHS